jgi:hypothetical protein
MTQGKHSPYRRILPGAAVLLYCLGALLSLATHAADPVQLTVRSTGYAEGVGYAARDRAVGDARQRALVEVLQALSASEDLKLFHPILRNVNTYVPTYDLLRHDQVGADTRVEIDAHVQEAPLHRDIAAIMLPRLPEKPKVLLVIGEQIGDDGIMAVPDFGAAEVALKEALEDKGLEVRGVDTLDKLYTHPQLMDVVSGSVELGSKFAKENPAHVIVVGTARSTYVLEEADKNLKKNTAEVKLNVFRGSDGKMISDVFSQAVVHSADAFEGGEAAVQDACRKAQQDVLTAAAITVLSTRASDGLLITVLDPETPERLAALVQAIESLPGAGKAQTLYFSPSLARLSMPYDDSLSYLVDSLSYAKPGGAAVEVTRVLKRDVEITFK